GGWPVNDGRGEPLARVNTELTIAVALEDAFTDDPPREPPSVRVENADVEFLRTPAGYHVLVDLPADPPTLDVVVESDRYLREERTVDRSEDLDADHPLVTIELVPGPGYPFGGGVTLVRGTVEEDDAPVAGATVSYSQGSAVTWADADGEYVLPVTGFESDDVVTDDEGTRFLEPGGLTPTIEAIHPDDGRTTDLDVPIPVGGTTSAHLDF
ncbi:MAG TPA: hypothetical protein VKA37_12440, partial [Halobacteriales archaeon]|nr:hypothetical protein [Halobacteriales archaeon]